LPVAFREKGIPYWSIGLDGGLQALPEAKQIADTEYIAVVLAAAAICSGIEMAPPEIQRDVSAQSDVDAQFIAIGSLRAAHSVSVLLLPSRWERCPNRCLPGGPFTKLPARSW
jgi:hypothetical protein